MDIDDKERLFLHVFCDTEAMQDTKMHVANPVVAETEEDDCPFHFKGDTCMAEFLEWLDTPTANDTRSVTVIAHNFQGYDGYFVVDEYHRQNWIVEQFRNGGKIMQLNFDRMHFIDSVFLSNAAVCFSKDLWTDSSRKVISLIFSTHQRTKRTLL